MINNKQFKILLINPPHIQKKGLYPKIVFEPIGLAYVGAYLEREGYDVAILDAIGLGFDRFTDIDNDSQLVGLSYDEINNSIKKISPNVVGIGVPFTIRAESAFAIASLVKKIDKNIFTVLGGIHPTTYPSECLKHPDIDFLIIGEGEVPMLNLANALRSNCPEDIAKIKGIGYKKEGNPVINPAENKVQELDELPFPARHLLPMERYFMAAKLYMSGRQGKKFASIITSRGCPFKCNFCVSHNIMGRKWRYRSPENVADEIEILINKYGINFVHFEDDNLTFNRDRMLHICELIIKRKLQIKWDTPNGVRADTITDEEVLLKMKESGCNHLCVAPESGNQYVVNNIFNKNLNLAKVEEVVRMCKKIGLKVDAFFVIGVVGETKGQIEDTISFAKKLRRLGASRCHFHIATPFEGTELYNDAKTKNFLMEAPEGCIKTDTFRIATDEFTVYDIDKYFIQGNKLNPVIPFDKVGLVMHLLHSDPKKMIKSSFNYLTKRVSGLSS